MSKFFMTCLPIPPQEHMVGRVGVEPTIPEGAGFMVPHLGIEPNIYVFEILDYF